MRNASAPRLLACLAALVALLVTAQPAAASELVARNATSVTLKVDSKGRAVVYYTIGGRKYHPVFWGAINAREPSRTIRQVEFRKDYSGGYMKLGTPLWKTIKNACQPYDGPRLPWFVTACKAPDGSYWALQRWQKMLPNLGYRPWKASQRAWELHLSHWKGELPVLEIHTDWAYSAKFHHVFGRLSYLGKPQYGFESTSWGSPKDSYGRNIYFDTYNSAYGDGWKRENSFLAHKGGGNFCYIMYNRPSYYDSTTRPPGNGERYRATVIGPGVLPDVMWQAPGLPNFNASNLDHVAYEFQMNVLGDLFAAGDDKCQQH